MPLPSGTTPKPPVTRLPCCGLATMWCCCRRMWNLGGSCPSHPAGRVVGGLLPAPLQMKYALSTRGEMYGERNGVSFRPTLTTSRLAAGGGRSRAGGGWVFLLTATAGGGAAVFGGERWKLLCPSPGGAGSGWYFMEAVATRRRGFEFKLQKTVALHFLPLPARSSGAGAYAGAAGSVGRVETGGGGRR